MDRKYKAADKVHVYASPAAKARGDKPLRVVTVKPYSRFGFDYYPVGLRTLAGYQDRNTGEVYAFETDVCNVTQDE